MVKDVDSILFENTPKIQDLARRCEENNAIDRELYAKYEVKRGLRCAVFHAWSQYGLSYAPAVYPDVRKRTCGSNINRCCCRAATYSAEFWQDSL